MKPEQLSSSSESDPIRAELERKGVYVGQARPFNIQESRSKFDVLNGEEVRIVEVDLATGSVTCEFLNPDLMYLNENFNFENRGKLFRYTFGIEELFNQDQKYERSSLKASERKVKAEDPEEERRWAQLFTDALGGKISNEEGEP